MVTLRKAFLINEPESPFEEARRDSLDHRDDRDNADDSDTVSNPKDEERDRQVDQDGHEREEEELEELRTLFFFAIALSVCPRVRLDSKKGNTHVVDRL